MNTILSGNKFLLACLFLASFLSACGGEKLVPACDGSNLTYNGGIKAIIDLACTSSGCHGSGSNNGEFTTYSNLLEVINNGKFEKKVFENQSMPKNGSLSQDQIDKLKCWADNAFPE